MATQIDIERDEQIALALGYTVEHVGTHRNLYRDGERDGILPHYSSDAGVALTLAETLHERGWKWNAEHFDDYQVRFYYYGRFGSLRRVEWADGETLAVAIAKAALLALRPKKGGGDADATRQ